MDKEIQIQLRLCFTWGILSRSFGLMKILAFDIGGAYTKKLVHKEGKFESSLRYFPVWKRKDELESFLSEQNEACDAVLITTTAELCDVFPSKAEGARFVASSCAIAFGDPIFLTLNKGLVKRDGVKDFGELAAANWIASLYLMEKKFGEGILVDVGSTTTDILPFGENRDYLKSDFERLRASQLVYTGRIFL
jgi:probable H4MPT-linked C1 transfer pathway protein